MIKVKYSGGIHALKQASPKISLLEYSVDGKFMGYISMSDILSAIYERENRSIE